MIFDRKRIRFLTNPRCSARGARSSPSHVVANVLIPEKNNLDAFIIALLIYPPAFVASEDLLACSLKTDSEGIWIKSCTACRKLTNPGELHIRSRSMSFPVQTPQRPLPGAYVQTPALSRYPSGQLPPPISRSLSAGSTKNHGFQGQGLTPAAQGQQVTADGGKPPGENLKPIDRAAKTVNEVLAQETKYPELDTYIGRKYDRTETSCAMKLTSA